MYARSPGRGRISDPSEERSACLPRPHGTSLPLLAITVSLDVRRRMRARPWLAHTQRDFAAMLIARAEPEDPSCHPAARGMTHWVARCAELRFSKQTGVA